VLFGCLSTDGEALDQLMAAAVIALAACAIRSFDVGAIDLHLVSGICQQESAAGSFSPIPA
jgi:hypothetical protein